MDGLIGQSDGPIRLAVFASVFLAMALIELLWPKRKPIVSKRKLSKKSGVITRAAGFNISFRHPG